MALKPTQTRCQHFQKKNNGVLLFETYIQELKVFKEIIDHLIIYLGEILLLQEQNNADKKGKNRQLS